MDARDVVLGQLAQLLGLGRAARADLLDVRLGDAVDLGRHALALVLGRGLHGLGELVEEAAVPFGASSVIAGSATAASVTPSAMASGTPVGPAGSSSDEYIRPTPRRGRIVLVGYAAHNGAGRFRCLREPPRRRPRRPARGVAAARRSTRGSP